MKKRLKKNFEKIDNNEKEKTNALRISIKEGSAASFSSGITNSYITPFALALKATPFHIGLLSSISGLASPIAQLFGSHLMEKYSRKRIVINCVLWQAILWLPLSLIAILSFKGIYTNNLVFFMIFSYTLLVILGGLAHPSWFSWMGDIVPEDKRGKYFSRRNMISGIVELVAVGLAVLILQFSQDKGFTMIGFSILFFLAFVGRFISYALFHYQYSPHLIGREKFHVPLKQLIKENKNFQKFAVYMLIFHIALMFASPFFSVYMLQELKFGYPLYIAISISSSIFYLIFLPMVGKISDKFGNIPLVYISNIFFILSPLMWVFIKNPIALIFFPQLISGIANAAFAISFTNFSYSTLSEEKRGVGVAYLNLLVGIGTFIGSIAGGILLSYFKISFINRFILIFIIAAVLRLLVALLFLPTLKEGKKNKSLRPIYLTLTHPFKIAGSFIHYLENKESEGLKVWSVSRTNVLRKEK